MRAPRDAVGPGDPTDAGQAQYTPSFLRIYDPLVLGLFATLIWRCPTRHLVGHYDRNLRRRHLDIGPGTGYFLERARRPNGAALTLVDPNPSVLAHASARLAHLEVSTVEADVCAPLDIDRRFDSAALNYVLHCLPGPMDRKAAAVANIAAVLQPEGVLFGATVLGTPELHTAVSGPALRANNRRGIFDNLEDDEAGLYDILDRSFANIDIEIIGCVAVFTANTPTTGAADTLSTPPGHGCP